jgi:hypothetical protein
MNTEYEDSAESRPVLAQSRKVLLAPTVTGIRCSGVTGITKNGEIFKLDVTDEMNEISKRVGLPISAVAPAVAALHEIVDEHRLLLSDVAAIVAGMQRQHELELLKQMGQR